MERTYSMKEFLKSFFNETFWKFIVVGLINTAVGMGVMYLYYNLINDNTFIAFALNIICGSTVSFFLNKNFTFKKKGSTGSSVVKFVINIVACYIISYGIADVFVPYILSGLSKTVVDNISMFISSCLFVACNYVGQRFFVFKKTGE